VRAAGRCPGHAAALPLFHVNGLVERDENLMTASRMFAALARSESGARAVAAALTDVFPWSDHLSEAERSDFAACSLPHCRMWLS
jgi:hypothetical protein